jgi:hypothetical protein
MNIENHSSEDAKWQALLARSNPTFAGETALPFGFLTSTLARIKAQKREREVFERIGLRSLFAAVVILLVVGGISVEMQLHSHTDFDPAVRSLLQADDVPIS